VTLNSAEHFEKRVMVRRASDVVDVARSQAFLAGRRTGELQFATTEKMVFELVHPRRREQHRRVPLRHQHVARTTHTAPAFKKFKILFAEFVRLHGLWLDMMLVIVGASLASVVPVFSTTRQNADICS